MMDRVHGVPSPALQRQGQQQPHLIDVGEPTPG